MKVSLESARMFRSAYLLPFYLICGVIVSIWIGSLWLNGYFGSYSWRQKLIIEVQTPTGPVVGSTVNEVSFFDDNIIVDGAQIKSSIKGEAVALDLGQGRYLFALLSHSEALDDVAWLAPKILWERDGVVGWDAIAEANSLAAPLTVPQKHYPMFVTFGDISDPASILEVNSQSIATVLGEGFSIRSVTLQRTSERLTHGNVEAVLPWLRSVGESRGSLIPPPFNGAPTRIQLVSPSDFSRQLFK